MDFLFVTSCTVDFLIFQIHTTLQSVTNKNGSNSNLTCGTSVWAGHYEVRFVRTTALKHHRELDDSSSTKSDQRDALTIANITREGKYIVGHETEKNKTRTSKK